MRHAREEFAREAGHLVDEAREFALAEHDELHVGLGDDGGVAGGFLEQRELAERVARAELRDLAAPAAHPGVALEDHEEFVARLTLRDQGLAGGDPYVLRPAGHQLEVLSGASREEGNLLE